MRGALALLFVIACGPIYPQPAPQPQPTQPTQPAEPDPTSGPTEDVAPAAPDPAPAPTTAAPRVGPKRPGLPPLVKSTKPAVAKTQAEIAVLKDWEGQQLFGKNRFAEASAKFREAVARVPEGRYFYNLCASLYSEGKFGEALTACDAVERNNPAPALSKMTQDLNDWIHDEARAQGITTTP